MTFTELTRRKHIEKLVSTRSERVSLCTLTQINELWKAAAQLALDTLLMLKPVNSELNTVWAMQSRPLRKFVDLLQCPQPLARNIHRCCLTAAVD